MSGYWNGEFRPCLTACVASVGRALVVKAADGGLAGGHGAVWQLDALDAAGVAAALRLAGDHNNSRST
jgi:hypothetical protein